MDEQPQIPQTTPSRPEGVGRTVRPRPLRPTLSLRNTGLAWLVCMVVLNVFLPFNFKIQ